MNSLASCAKHVFETTRAGCNRSVPVGICNRKCSGTHRFGTRLINMIIITSNNHTCMTSSSSSSSSSSAAPTSSPGSLSWSSSWSSSSSSCFLFQCHHHNHRLNPSLVWFVGRGLIRCKHFVRQNYAKMTVFQEDRFNCVPRWPFDRSKSSKPRMCVQCGRLRLFATKKMFCFAMGWLTALTRSDGPPIVPLCGVSWFGQISAVRHRIES